MRVILAFLALLSGCSVPAIPGDENMGLYGFTVEPVATDDGGQGCQLDGVFTSGFGFEGTLSRDTDGGGAYLTLGGYSRPASWDGQVFSSTAVAPRVFEACGTCPVQVREVLTVALLSRSQAQVVGLSCPPAPLDGGVPAPDADAGIRLPGRTEQGYDGLLLCGELVAQLEVVDGGTGTCPEVCLTCSGRFRATATRR